MKIFFGLLLIASTVVAADLEYNAAITAVYGDDYNFYSYSENRMDLNIFYKDVQSWIQYEYSNPPEIGFTMNDIRKFRIEYVRDDFTIKVGDIYEFWGRGLVLNQIDDQSTNYDNGTRGIFLGYSNNALSINHINGNTGIWLIGLDPRIPHYKNSHNITANQIQYDWSSVTLGLTQLRSNEIHQKLYGDAYVNHKLNGVYGSWLINNADVFFEYVDKKSTEKISDGISHDSLKNGYGLYGNLNVYLGNWGLSTEYKRYSFDRSHTDFTADDYGNRIGFQMMPTLGREQNSTLLGRVVHQYNYNDERGFQVEVNGALPLDHTLTAQYSHLSRNNEWLSNTPTDWLEQEIDGFLPSSKKSALPYWESYQEISGYHFNDKLFFRIGYGINEEILKLDWYYDGMQTDMLIDSYWNYDTTAIPYGDGTYYYFIDSTGVMDTSFTDPYSVESKLWQEGRSITFPFELSYLFDNGYSIELNCEYQERVKRNVSQGNATTLNYSDSTWSLINPDNPDTFFTDYSTQFSDGIKQYDTQFNRMISLTLSKAPKWSVTLSHDQTNAFEGPQQIDPYYNPLEALVFGDLKYFTGERDKTNPPDFVQKRWLSMEVAYNMSSSQRISVMYGSIQGGLFCSNGICRQIAPFNDGLKVTYSAIF
jgi:hypothetical protein